MVELEFRDKTKALIDSLKSICANYGLGNDGNEFKIITQAFLYKFLNDKFAFEAKQKDIKYRQRRKLGRCAQRNERRSTEKAATADGPGYRPPEAAPFYSLLV